MTGSKVGAREREGRGSGKVDEPGLELGTPGIAKEISQKEFVPFQFSYQTYLFKPSMDNSLKEHGCTFCRAHKVVLEQINQLKQCS